MPFALQPSLQESVIPMESKILRQFLLDYLNRFEVYQLFFEIDKPNYNIAGQTRNTSTIAIDNQEISLAPLLTSIGVPSHISIGGDFTIGYDFANIPQASASFHDQIGLSIFDTANHGYEAFFLAGHIRALLLNLLDKYVRDFREIDNHLFVELNELLKGPVTQDLVEKTNPVRTSLTKGAVGIHGQLHRQAHRFNFVCTGLPIFYYSKAMTQFFYLEPNSGPPLGYFNKSDSFFKPYVPHSIKLHPGDYLIMATDGCFDSICVEDDSALPLGLPKKPVLHFNYPTNDSLDVMHSFDAKLVNLNALTQQRDPAVLSLCYVLESHLQKGSDAQIVVKAALDILNTNECFNGDDQSLIVVRVDA